MLQSRRLAGEVQLQHASRNAPALKVGATGAGVAALQDALVDLGHKMPLSFKQRKPDGIYGAETEAAVKAFQQAHGLRPDGQAGALTLATLDKLIVDTPRLDFPDPAAVTIDDLSQRGRPLVLRRNANL